MQFSENLYWHIYEKVNVNVPAVNLHKASRKATLLIAKIRFLASHRLLQTARSPTIPF